LQDRDSSTLLEQWTHDFKFKSSEPAGAGNGREKISEKEFLNSKIFF